MRNYKSLLIKKSLNFSNKIESEIQLLLAYLKSGLDYEVIKDIIDSPYEDLKSYTQQVYPQDKVEILSEFFSYQDLLNFTYESKVFNKDLKRQIIKILAYPLLLYFLMYALMLFFMLILLPAMFNIIELFEIDLSSIQLLSKLLKATFIGLSIFNVILIFVLITHLNHERLRLSLIRYSNLQLPKAIYTYQFAHFFYLLVKHGFSTKQALEIMRRGSDNRLIGWLATLIMYKLEAGKPFSKSIDLDVLDNRFISICQLGIINNQLPSLLETYLNTNHLVISNRLKQIGSMIKLFTYSLLAILILFMYQILLAPLSLMGNL